MRRHRAVGVLADDDEALLGAQHMHALGAVGGDVEVGAGFHHRLPERLAVAGLDVELVAHLAREADAEDPAGQAGDGAGAPVHELELLRREIDVGAQAGEHLARLGAHQGHGGPVVGDRAHPDLELGPLGLVPALQPAQHLGRAAGGGGHVELGVGDAGGDAVIHDHAVLVEHQAVAALARCELAPGVRVDAVEELARVGAVDLDLAQRGGVHDGHAGACGAALAGHGRVQVLALLREVPGAHPVAHRFQLGLAGHVAGVDGGGAHRVEGLALHRAGQRAQAHRGVGGPVGGGADLGDRALEGARGDDEAVDVGQLALVGAEAQGGEALDVLDVLPVLADGELDVGGGHVVLVVDEGLGAGALGAAVGHTEHRARALARGAAAHRRGQQCRGAQLAQHLLHRLGGLGQRLLQIEGAGDRTDAGHALAALARRDEGGDALVPGRAAAVVAEQVHRGREAAGAQQRVAAQGRARAGDLVAVRVQLDQARSLDLAAPACLRHRKALVHGDARLQATGKAVVARIDHMHLGAGGGQRVGRVVDQVAGAGDHHRVAHAHAVAAQEGLAGRDCHHAGQVVVAEDQRALDRAGGQHDMAGADLVLPLARQVGLARADRQVILHQLDGQHQIVLVEAEGGGAAQAGHMRHRRQLGQRRGQEAVAVAPVDVGARVRQQPAAELALLVEQHGLQAGATRLQRRQQPGRTAPDHQHVDMVVEVVIVIRVGLGGRAAEAGELADHRLVGRPEAARPLEGLAVEARRHEARGAADDRLQVEVQRGPARGRARLQALVQLGLRGLDVGHGVRAFLHLHQRVGLLGAGADQAARAPVLEAARQAHLARRQQRRGQRVAGKSRQGLAVELEADRPAAVDAGAGNVDAAGGHARSPRPWAFISASNSGLPSASVQLPEIS
ncbi:hypothetical protein X805_31030 [Sphaerotilus natans subsp. natans DSM 6575]|uniref:Uncharacterized protein n=1 Tax=Sphaerotilus natans subsp. natans DSM 6575 TaxID=1286631 RepID=A0A059KIT3_9BURK|nr:hypothetical protein X805_31030 [Sphaerotilus natans subsp. natans DSM 6575]